MVTICPLGDTQHQFFLFDIALDHIYVTEKLKERTKASKLKNSSTDNLPIKAEVELLKVENRVEKSIIRRSMKDFTKAKWNRSLAGRRWERIGETEDIEEMTNTFNELVLDALDECAPP